MQTPKRRGTWWFAGMAGATGLVVIDSNSSISVQLANVFAYAGHRALPACSSWSIEVEDAQGLPLGDAMFTYVCK